MIKIIKEIYLTKEEAEQLQSDEEFIEAFKEKMLNCDYERAGLPRLSDEVLTNKKLGHWDLWDYNEQREKDCNKKITLPEGQYFYARNPFEDVIDSVVAIDFGTESTVAGYLDKGQFVPIQVNNVYNNGNLDRYENLSVMHFVDFEHFIEDYNRKVGRPDTKWNDLTVSNDAHEAQQDCYYGAIGNFDSFLNDLLSWCSSNKRDRIKDKKGKIYEFPAYFDIKDGEPDPIEYYAYYLGLFINKMVNHRIFKNYEMSFPVTFTNELKQKIIQSFKKGITKSLPTALLNDERFNGINIIESFSKPVAYTITALKKYNFNDKLEELEKEGIENPECCYAVFDFGDKTTNFDFGIYSFSDEDRFYDYKLVDFGQNGVKNLGAENLLKYLAFEIFKLNVKRLHADEDIDVKFTTYDGCSLYECVGFEDYILKDSPVAISNMFRLMEKLRWVWEDPNAEKHEPQMKYFKYVGLKVDLYDTNGALHYIQLQDFLRLKVDLYDTNGAPYRPVELVITKEDNGDAIKVVDLQKLLRKKIEEGIESFFHSMVFAFRNYDKDYLKDKDEISIFLAGNSSKNVLFNQILSEYLEELEGIGIDIEVSEEEIYKKHAFISSIKDRLGNPDLKFVVYPLLKTKESKEKLQSMGYDLDLSDPTEPSGKTGVAYGILVDRVCVEDGFKEKTNVEKKSNADNIDIPFKFYVATERRSKLNVAIEKNSKFGEWNKLCNVSNKHEYYRFFSTTSDEAYSGKMRANNAISHTIVIDEPQDDTFIFVRAINPNTIECQISDSIENLKDVENPNLIALED